MSIVSCRELFCKFGFTDKAYKEAFNFRVTVRDKQTSKSSSANLQANLNNLMNVNLIFRKNVTYNIYNNLKSNQKSRLYSFFLGNAFLEQT